MGEKIKKLGEIQIHGKLYDVELNEPHVATKPNQVHIQSDDFRFEINELDFYRMGLLIKIAEKKLKKIKSI